MCRGEKLRHILFHWDIWVREKLIRRECASFPEKYGKKMFETVIVGTSN